MATSDCPSGTHIQNGPRKNERYITGVDAAGQSVVLASPGLRFLDRGGYAISRLYTLDAVPGDINDDRDLQHYLNMDGHVGEHTIQPTSFQLVPPGGANFIQGDFGPSSSSTWHRTISVDFVTVVEGELELHIGENDDNCKAVHLHTGDSVIQRGTLHKWVNSSTEKPARFVATLLACSEFKLGDKTVEPVWIPRK